MVNAAGEVTLTRRGGPVADRGARVLIEVLTTLIDPTNARNTTIDFVQGTDPRVFGGSFNLRRVDLLDLATLGAGLGTSETAVLVHELYEQYLSQVRDEPYHRDPVNKVRGGAHEAAIRRAEDVATGATRDIIDIDEVTRRHPVSGRPTELKLMTRHALASGLTVGTVFLVDLTTGNIVVDRTRAPAVPQIARYVLDLDAIDNPSTGLVVDVELWRTADRSRVHTWTHRTTGNVNNQRWTARIVGGDATAPVVVIANANAPAMCLDKSLDLGNHDGAAVYIFSCAADGRPRANQEWRIRARGGAFELRNRSDDRCLDIRLLNTAIDGDLHAWTCNGTWNQFWR